MAKHFLAQKLCLMAFFLCASPNAIAADSCPEPDPDVLTESSLAYRSGPYKLDTLLHREHPFDSFAISVDQTGSGHLQSYAVGPSKHPPAMKGSVILDWKERTSYYKEGKSWTQLTLEGAKELWGQPRKHIVYDHPFYTFDAHSTWNGEENLYHLDLGFDKNGLIMGYRVRGIGIFNPQWVTAPNQPWVIEHVVKKGVYE